ncbi:Na+/H+ antiporter NhaA [Haloactinopolyspora alba]|uniref:Na(+)/H(+) antiporter NhaA n=1 Tax=Haloactinopolyspora alba TaxID=648780 RepID=A0A2P8DN88_9ACTN|nr:Na+/H+ antiporter NhaA [Haloactinopolyspora alba]PSK98663.1 Na+/H+ antiporter NhaA [Haloactinopolyspora alba]
MTRSAREQTRPSRRVLVAQMREPLRKFLATEAGSAGVMLAAVGAALGWANSPWSDSYESLLHTEATVRIGDAVLSMDAGHWISDGLMALFFLVIGLEVRRELSIGELTERRRVVVPVLGALAGMVVPALLYLAINPSGAAADGWGVVIATDTALVLGALAIVGPASSTQLRIFLLSVAVFDDIVAVAIIGVVYSGSIDLLALAVAGAMLVLIAVLSRRGEWRYWVYAAAFLVLWVATVRSGLHASIAGMVAGLLIGARPPRRADVERVAARFRAFQQAPRPDVGDAARSALQQSVSMNERLQVILHPAVAYVIVPLFVLANAGVDLRGGVFGDAITSPVTWGIVAGLVAGKTVGIGATALVSSRLGAGPLPTGVGEGQVIGGAALSGIGFTVSLLIANLAFTDTALLDAATVGVLLGAVLATLTAWVVFRLAAVLRGERTASLPVVLDRPVDPARDHIRGPVDAPLTLVEYGDFECPFCSRATGVVDSLMDRFGDDLRYVFRHLPLADVHPKAILAAEAAEAAAAQGAFWQMHDRLFAHQSQLEPPDLLTHAAVLGLDVERFSRELGTGLHGAHIREDVASAEASGATGTPTFFVDGHRQVGRYDEEALAEALTGGQPPPAVETPAAGTRGKPEGPGVPVIGRLRSGDTDAAPLVLEGLEESPDRDGIYARLSPDQLAALSKHGERRRLAAREPLFGDSEPGADFVVVLSGTVALVDGYGHDNRVRGVHGRGRFLGGLGTLRGEAMFLTPVAQQDAEVLTIPPERLRTALDADPRLRETVLRTYLLRRSYLIEQTAVRMVGSGASADARRLREFLTARDVMYSWLDLDTDENASAVLQQLGVDPDDTPVAVTRDRRVLLNPSEAELAESLGLDD